MKKIDAINIVPNCEFSNVTAEVEVKSESPGTFKIFMQSQEMQNAKEMKLEPDLKNLFMLSFLGKNTLEEISDIETESKQTGSENEKEDSRCCDSNLQNLVDGIVGIIEGFGLLDCDTDESIIDKVSEQIVSITNQDTEKTDISKMIGNLKMPSEEIARMPNANQNQEIPQEAVQMIEELIGEYQCSFDNTNNTGVKKADLTQGADKIKLMIKVALDKSIDQKTKQIGFYKQEVTDKEKISEKSDSAYFMDKNTSETLKTAEIGTKENIELKQPLQKDMEENVAKIAQKITASQTEGKKEFDVTLKPGYLGKLSIKITMDGDGMKAQIKAADQYVRGLISEQLPELSQALKEKGINMSNIEVVYESPMFSSTEQQFQGQNQFMSYAEKGLGAFMAKDSSIEDISYNAIMDHADLSLRNSSVEFIA